MAKQKFYLEIESNRMICGGFICSLEATVKQAIAYAERLGRDYFNNNPSQRGRGFYEVNICTDEDCLDMAYSVSVWGCSCRRQCDVRVYDYATEDFIRWE